MRPDPVRQNKVFFCRTLKIWFVFFIWAGMGIALAGENRALVIGIDRYEDPGIAFPQTASKDAAAMAELLERQMGFKVTRLLGASATRASILKNLESLCGSAVPEDGLLIYYAGAAEIENLYGYGWWLGADARKGDTQTYVEVSAIQQIFRQTQARRLLLISDAPFPDSACGAPLSDSDGKVLGVSEDDTYAHMILRNQAGGVAGTEAKNSPLVTRLQAVLPALEGQLEGRRLFTLLRPELVTSGGNLDYRALRTGKKAGGDLVFTKPDAGGAATAAVIPPEPVPAVRDLPAILEIRSSTEGARVKVNGQDRGLLPVRITDMDAGGYRIEISAPGHEDLREEVRLAAGETRELHLALTAEKPKEGGLMLSTEPRHAVVTFERDTMRYAPEMSLQPGLYVLRVRAPLYEEKRIEVRIDAGKTEKTHVVLTLLPAYENAMGMKFIRVASGTFLMGSPDAEIRRSSDEKQHKVIISKPFFMQAHEVTVAQWRAFVASTGYKTEAELGPGAYGFENGFRWALDPDYDWENPGYPVEAGFPVSAVSYHDVQAFIAWVREKEGFFYDLPSEAEWEYVARAGGDRVYAYGDCLQDTQANFAANSFRTGCPVGIFRKTPLSVGSLSPNAWGFFDMHGNVWEWCRDWYGKYPEGEDPVRDPAGPEIGQKRVLRGGGWDTDLDSIRASKRYSMEPSSAYTHTGFRLVIRP